MLISKKEMNEWTHVILDEVHEREEDMDLVMLICKKLLLTYSRGTKLILMSATMNHITFVNYFSVSQPGLPTYEKPAFLEVGNNTKQQRVSEYHRNTMSYMVKQRYPDLAELATESCSSQKNNKERRPPDDSCSCQCLWCWRQALTLQVCNLFQL